MSEWLDHVERWKGCQKCPLGCQRGNICIARGTVPCDVCFIGEAPGQVEDDMGQPFVGPAGKLLDQMIERALPPQVTYAMTNLVCCFPREAKARGDNEPEPEEILACRPRLIEFVNIAQPRLIVTVGSLAQQWIEIPLSTKWVHILHPAYILQMKAPLVQKEAKVNNEIVRLHKAISDMLESKRVPFIKWRIPDASVTTKERLRSEWDTADAAKPLSEREIPF